MTLHAARRQRPYKNKKENKIMRPCEDVIVTVNISEPAVSYDMELPAFMRIDELKKKLLETLRLMDIRKFASVSEIELLHAGANLHGNETLAGHGIWDGSSIEIRTNNKK